MSMNLQMVIQKVVKYWVATLVTGAFSGTALLGKAETPDTFKRHHLPIPGAYFAKKESQKAVNVAISKSGKGVGAQKQAASKTRKNRV
jgi:hypothetical protein